MEYLNKIAFGDCLDILKAIPSDSLDCCITDPPYGWSFMGKKWDYDVPAIEIWREVLRVIKPGAHILVACGTRTQHRMAVNIEDAGFEIRDVICWHYGSGYPKNLNISKAIDKAAGAIRETISEGKTVKRLIPGADQHKTGSWIKDNGETYTYKVTLPATDEARKWNGWGTALKPATEFWTLARKSISEKTISANVIKHSVGALNIDACRIEYISEEDKKSAIFGTGTCINNANYGSGNHILDTSKKNIQPNDKGRFPANVILDDFMADKMDGQSGELTSGKPSGKDNASTKSRNIYGKFAGGRELTGYGDTGGASRFFYIAKPSSEERSGSTHLTIKPQSLIQYLLKLICPIEEAKIMLDPFAGSGSHCIAAKKLGINFIGIEKDENYQREATERLKKEFGLFY